MSRRSEICGLVRPAANNALLSMELRMRLLVGGAALLVAIPGGPASMCVSMVIIMLLNNIWRIEWLSGVLLETVVATMPACRASVSKVKMTDGGIKVVGKGADDVTVKSFGV